MKFDFIIFGGTGIQGRICARDLLESGYKVALVGRDKSQVSDLLKDEKAKFFYVDLKRERAIVRAIKKTKADVVINCAELTFNVPIMKACLKTRKPCTDLGGLYYITKEQFRLHEAFKKAGILCITGCGSTPGILNVLTAYAIKDYDSVNSINLGFAWDSNIKKFVVPYSIKSIFREFEQPPIVFHDGNFIKSSRARCLGRENFREIGEQTVYCIEHSEVYTFAKYFKDKKIKNINYMAGFPEHSLNLILNLMETGFNSDKEIEIRGQRIKPLTFTTEMLKKIEVPENYKESEVLWANIEGKSKGRSKKTRIECVVKTLDAWKDAGSNVDTGRTISIISQMVKRDFIKDRGVFAPEAVVPQDLFLSEIGRRKMFVYIDGKRIN
ncbi:MAG: saccharopine dehydrogenase C-terminal domain-containing protein [Nanoarchaeota archaeon]|nr:saccharopine dehydrogenase C-terminal domain-containing protein [Nanoarchaeota archaeon]